MMDSHCHYKRDTMARTDKFDSFAAMCSVALVSYSCELECEFAPVASLVPLSVVHYTICDQTYFTKLFIETCYSLKLLLIYFNSVRSNPTLLLKMLVFLNATRLSR